MAADGTNKIAQESKSRTTTLDHMMFTRGQQWVDTLVWSCVTEWKGLGSTIPATSGLNNYIASMGGNADELVAKLKIAQWAGFEKPTSHPLLKAAGRSRRALEDYVEVLEIRAGKRQSFQKHHNGRLGKSQGWSVYKNRFGNWRVALTSLTDGRPRHIGTYKTRKEARRVGRQTVANLREAAA